MRFWLDRGVDGFRMDVINMISKTPGLPDGGLHYALNGPHWLDYLREMQHTALAGRDVVTIGETPGVSASLAAQVTDAETGVLDMLFHFEHVSLDQPPHGSKWLFRPMPLAELKAVVNRWQDTLADHGWNSLYLGNHDQPRAVSRFGNAEEYRRESAAMLLTLLLTLQGTPFIYQGDEIGMSNVAFGRIEDYRDLETLNAYAEMCAQGTPPDEALLRIQRKSRDNARTPMQWDASPNAGFTTGTPWIAVNPNADTVNVAQALADPESILHYTRRLIRLRQDEPLLALGRYTYWADTPDTVWAYERSHEGRRVLVLLNFSPEQVSLTLPARLHLTPAQRWIGNYPETALAGDAICLRAYEAAVFGLDAETGAT